jgi:SAM-dependent methyltransferase
MAKQHEIDYPVQIGDSLAHAAAKPFSDPQCGQYLIRIGTMMSLLPRTPARVLDLGCGTGWTSRFFARAGYDVVGVDIAPEMIRVANECRAAEKLSGVSFLVSDYETLAFRDEFDAVVFFDCLHHADDEALAIRKAFAALKPGGVLLADEPGVGHSTTPESLAAMAKYGVTEKDMPPSRIVELGRAAGFDAFRVFPAPEALASAVYTGRAEAQPDPFADTDPAVERLHSTGLRRALNRAVARLGATPSWRLTNVDHLLLHVRDNGLVMMRKGAHAARAAA